MVTFPPEALAILTLIGSKASNSYLAPGRLGNVDSDGLEGSVPRVHEVSVIGRVLTVHVA